MQRKNFYLSDVEIKNLEAESTRLDIASSDLLRRIIDKHFEEKQLAGFGRAFENTGGFVMASGLSAIE